MTVTPSVVDDLDALTKTLLGDRPAPIAALAPRRVDPAAVERAVTALADLRVALTGPRAAPWLPAARLGEACELMATAGYPPAHPDHLLRQVLQVSSFGAETGIPLGVRILTSLERLFPAGRAPALDPWGLAHAYELLTDSLLDEDGARRAPDAGLVATFGTWLDSLPDPTTAPRLGAALGGYQAARALALPAARDVCSLPLFGPAHPEHLVVETADYVGVMAALLLPGLLARYGLMPEHPLLIGRELRRLADSDEPGELFGAFTAVIAAGADRNRRLVLSASAVRAQLETVSYRARRRGRVGLVEALSARPISTAPALAATAGVSAVAALSFLDDLVAAGWARVLEVHPAGRVYAADRVILLCE